MKIQSLYTITPNGRIVTGGIRHIIFTIIMPMSYYYNTSGRVLWHYDYDSKTAAYAYHV